MNWQTNPAAATPPDSAEPLRSIQQVCTETGLTARTVRYYEELGLLPNVRRRAGGRRVYGQDELERLRFIQRLKTLGLPLGAIRELNAVHAIAGSTRAMLDRLDELLGRRLAEVDARLAELTHLRAEIARYREHVETRIGGPARRRAGGRR